MTSPAVLLAALRTDESPRERQLSIAVEKMKASITQERLKELLDYDKTTGEFTWRVRSGIRITVGKTAGSVHPQGYIRIRIDSTSYGAHRLAWLYVYGEYPRQLDHADGNKANNRITNLRLSTTSQNMANKALQKNNQSGMKGVSFNKSRGLWKAKIQINGRSIYLGAFANAHEARDAYETAAQKHFGEFARIIR